jgi:hypothetical protein
MIISLIPNQRVDTIHASQNDTCRVWEFRLIVNDSIITPTGSASLICDGEEIPMEIDGNTVSCDSALLTSKSGIFPCKIKLTQGDEVLYSSLFYLHIEVKP